MVDIKMSKLKSFFIFIFELVKIVVISLVIIVPIRYFLIQPFYVKGASMEPNFYEHEYLIINEIVYRLSEPKRGDIIVFRYPKNPQEYFIKRVIGLPGETIELKEGAIYIKSKEERQGQILREPYLEEGVKTYSLKESVVSLDENEYYVLGDNRNLSKDSRTFGPVNKGFVVGRVMLRGWPFNRFGFFKETEY